MDEAMDGAVAAGNAHTARAGAEVLEAGGSAIDALVAAALCGFVAEGPLTGPAGGGFLLLHGPGVPTRVLDCFFAVPSRPIGVAEEVVIDFGDASTQTFHVGPETVAVPGLLAGLELAHRRLGSLPWRDLFSPAIDLAHAGVAMTEAQQVLLEMLVPILHREEGGRRVYGDPAFLRTHDLVPALEHLRDEGAAGMADLLPELSDDIRSYRVMERDPIAVRLGDATVLTTPPPSLGGRTVERGLRALEGRLGEAGSGAEALALASAVTAAYDLPPGAAVRLTGTTHVSVVDAAGNAAGLSSTLGSGSGVFHHGFQLNNMLGETDVIGESVPPAGSRLPSMMAPTLVIEGGDVRLLLGSAGSVRLAGAILQVVIRVVTEGIGVEEAIALPRVHAQADGLHLEGGWGAEAIAVVEDAGYPVVRWSARNLFFGGVSAVEHRPGGRFAAAGDPRRGGHGVVVRRGP